MALLSAGPARAETRRQARKSVVNISEELVDKIEMTDANIPYVENGCNGCLSFILVSLFVADWEENYSLFHALHRRLERRDSTQKKRCTLGYPKVRCSYANDVFLAVCLRGSR